MIECSCRVLTTADFKRAVEQNADAIETAGSLPRAVGIAYNAAREDKPHGRTKSCTTCLPSLAERIQEAGFYQDETYEPVDRFKIKAAGSACAGCAKSGTPACTKFVP